MRRHFDNWIKAYLEYKSFNEAPDSFAFWTAVSVIAGALRAKVYLDMGGFWWSPSFYTILVGRAGRVNKSTAINSGMELLREIPGVTFGASSLTWQALLTDLQNAAEGIMDPGTGEVTTYCCLTFAASELGSLLDPRDRFMMDVLTDLWGGDGSKLFSRSTKGEGQKVAERPWLNILAGTTPEWIADNMPKAVIGAGFTSRCIFVYEEHKRMLIPYPKRAAIKAGRDVFAMRKPLLDDLAQIASLQGEFVMTESAYVFGEKWYHDHYDKPPLGLSESDFGGYISRKQAHIHKLAMILSAAKRNDLSITKEDLEEALAIVSSLEPTMPLVLGKMHADDKMEPLARMAEVLTKHKRVPKAILYRQFQTQMTYKDFEVFIGSLVAADYVTVLADNDTTWLVWKGKEK